MTFASRSVINLDGDSSLVANAGFMGRNRIQESEQRNSRRTACKGSDSLGLADDVLTANQRWKVCIFGIPALMKD